MEILNEIEIYLIRKHVLNMSCQELANYVGVTKQTISNLENKKTKSNNKCLRIALTVVIRGLLNKAAGKEDLLFDDSELMRAKEIISDLYEIQSKMERLAGK